MTARDSVRPLLRTRQIREFTDEPVSDEMLAALADVGRWSGSSSNNQPWRFVVIRDEQVLRRLAEIGVPQTWPFQSASAGIAIVLTDEAKRESGGWPRSGRSFHAVSLAAAIVPARAEGMLRVGGSRPCVRIMSETNSRKTTRSSSVRK